MYKLFQKKLASFQHLTKVGYHLKAVSNESDDLLNDRTEQNIYFIDINCTVSCQIHEYNKQFTNGNNICILDLTTKS